MVYDTGVPPTPTALSATTPTNPKPVLTWQSGGADNLSGFDHYNVYRTGTLIGTTAALTFTDNALSAAGTQTYTVKAVDAAGNVSNASTGKAVIWDPADAERSGQADDPEPGDRTPRSPGRRPPTPAARSSPATTSTAARRWRARRPRRASSTRPSLADGTYTYKVIAIDGAGNVSTASPTNSVIVDATAPTAPTGLTGITPTIAKPALSWSPATDNAGGSGVAKYNVYRGIVLAGSSTGTTFTDNGLTVNGTYGYTVRAVDAAGNEGAPSTQFDVVYDSAAPPVPTNLTAASPTGAAPVLSWTSGGAASDFDHYNVYRAGALIGMTPTTAYTDTTLTVSGSYAYTVKAVDVNGNQSAASTPKTVVFDVTAPTTPATAERGHADEPPGADLDRQHRHRRGRPGGLRGVPRRRVHRHDHDPDLHRRRGRRRRLLLHRQGVRQRGQLQRRLVGAKRLGRHDPARSADRPDGREDALEPAAAALDAGLRRDHRRQRHRRPTGSTAAASA